ncbi:DUF1456 family protein [Cellvibrio sp. NN19]|uniref:DUF1456 family protein n=1 Tax=Cellvibrio chitinivorans TaxID=3102792 RepID=UPI002B414102|nr:DUF1456 family protein [Cellvibrio sp. NN19]
MTNNDVLRRLRFIFDFSDSQMMALFASGGFNASREQVSDWMKNEENPDFKVLHDVQLAIFLNGLINKKRGQREGAQPEPEKKLNNNIILRKLKIALEFKDDDILEMMTLAGFPLGKHELSAFFRKPGHNNYRECQSQVLRNFLKGLQIKLRGTGADTAEPAAQ